MKNEPKIVKEGYVVITPTICQGDVMAWSTEDDDGEAIPTVFDTEEDAWKEIADSMIEELQQFIDGERELEDTNFGTEDYVAQYEEFDNGEIVVSSLPGREDSYGGNPIIETTLEKWRANR